MVINVVELRPILINNRYELVEKIGEGGMGAVYRAIDHLNNETIALKRVNVASPDASSEKTDKKNKLNRLALTSEFQALASLHHPNIVGVIDYGWDRDDKPFFTMPYVNNAQTLFNASEHTSLETRLNYLVQLVQALMYVHRRGIVHRDLKPDNILVTDNGQVKVLDFGIAAYEHDAQEGLVGTMLYLPPESIGSGIGQLQISRTADLYALGLIAYEMFTGEFPYDSSDTATLLRDILHKLPDLSLIPEVGEGEKKLNTRLPLQTIIGRLTGKDPKFRYQDCADVIEDLAQIVGPDAIGVNTEVRESYLQAATFVGRKLELQQLLAHLRCLRKSRESSTFLIGGESGVGKSRLMEEVRIHALVEGVTVLRGQGVSGGGLPFQLWHDVVRRLILSTKISDEHASLLRAIVPDIDDILERNIPPTPVLQGEIARTRLIKAILKLFVKQKKPILLLLEDLHWMIESLEVLKTLNQHIEKLPIMIIATFRDDEKTDLPQELPNMQLMKLNRLFAEEIAELSASMLGKVGKQPQIVELLQRETEGNVFFVVEVVRTLAEIAGNLDDIGKITLPEHVFAGGMRTVIQRRLDQLDPSSYDVLKLAAIYGRYLDLNLLSQITDLSTDDFENWLNGCANATVLEVFDGDWRFTHDKLREHIINQLPEDELEYLSQQVAQVVERLYGENLHWAEVLMNLWGSARDTHKELQYMSVVVDRLIVFVGDYDRAREFSEYALSLLPEDSELCVDFLNPLSQLSWRSGAYDEAHEYATRAIRLSKRFNNTKGLAQSYNNMGNTAYYLGHYETAIIYYRQSAEIYHEIGNQWHRALNLQNIGWTYPFLNDYESAWDYTEQGQAIFIELEDVAGIANGYYIMALIATHEGDYNDALEFHHKSLDLNVRTDDVWTHVLNLTNMGFVYLELHELEKAQNVFYECIRLAHNSNLLGSVLEALVGFARLYLHYQGEKRSAVLMGMVHAHPAMNSDVRMRMEPLQEALELALPDKTLKKALEQGATMDIDDVVQKMLVQAI